MAAPSYCNNTGWEKTMFSWVGKLNYSIKTQLGLNDLSWILSQNGSRLNCPRMFRKLNTSPYAYSSTLTTLETFIVIESSLSYLSLRNPCFTQQNTFSERTSHHLDLSSTPPGLGYSRMSPGWKSMSWKSLSRKTALLRYGCRWKIRSHCAH